MGGICNSDSWISLRKCHGSLLRRTRYKWICASSTLPCGSESRRVRTDGRRVMSGEIYFVREITGTLFEAVKLIMRKL
jgi:hypothetical protein